MTATNAVPKRIYTEDLQVHPELDRRGLLQQVHALYTHWLRRNFYPRDFGLACDHCARYLVSEHLAGCRPALAHVTVTMLPLAAPATKPQPEQKRRLFDEVESISPEADIEQVLAALAPLFSEWVQAGWHARDFPEAVHMCAEDVYYMHRLAREMGGIGSGPTAAQFLRTPYCG